MTHIRTNATRFFRRTAANPHTLLRYEVTELDMLHIVQRDSSDAADGTSFRDSILNDVLLYIDSHYQENLKLDTIAPLFGYSSAYLGKIFAKNVGENFNSYVDRCRIERSKELLKNEKWKVYEVAAQVGYRNVDYFHKKFHKYVGMTPLQYRRQQTAGGEKN